LSVASNGALFVSFQTQSPNCSGGSPEQFGLFDSHGDGRREKIKFYARRSQRLSNAFALTADVAIIETTNTGAKALVINQAKAANFPRSRCFLRLGVLFIALIEQRLNYNCRFRQEP
jgi:hypothetical protein